MWKVKFLELLKTYICVCEHMQETTPRDSFYIFRHKEIYCIFQRCCMVSVLLPTKLHLSHYLSFLHYLNNTFFINRPIKFKYPLWQVEVEHHVLEVVYWALQYRSMHFCPLAHLPKMLWTNSDGNYCVRHFRNCIGCLVFNHICH